MARPLLQSATAPGEWGKRLVGFLRTRGLCQAAVRAVSRWMHMEQVGNFLILSTGRSGSTLLVTYLDCHPQIRCRGEVLNPAWVTYGDPRGRPRAWLRRHLDALWFKRPGQLAGGKILTHDFDDLDLSLADVLDVLRPRVLVLYREDLLEWYTSVCIGQKNRRWTSKDRANEESIVFDWDRYREYTGHARELWRTSLEQLEGHPTLLLSFERLKAERDAVMNEVFEFLGVEPCPVSSPLVRQNPRPVEQKISNYQELELATALPDEQRFLRLSPPPAPSADPASSHPPAGSAPPGHR